MAEYGRTWWGKKWLDAFIESSVSMTERSLDEGTYYINDRFDRGKKYANAGKVLDIKIVDNVVFAIVSSSYGSYYRIQIKFQDFTPSEHKIIEKLVTKSWSFVSSLINRQLPQDFSNQLHEHKIDLFPASFHDIQTQCDCYDYVNPCKHIIAVMYVLSTEIDKNPRLLFDVRDCKIINLIDDLNDGKLEKFQKVATIKDLFKKSKNELIPFDQSVLDILNFSTIPNLQAQIYRMLKKSPLFFEKDFREILQACYKYWQKNPEGKYAAHFKAFNATELTAEELFFKAWPHAEQWKSFQLVVDHKNKLTHVFCDGNNIFDKSFDVQDSCVEFLYDMPLSIMHRLHPSLQFMHKLVQFALELMKKSALIPQVITTKKNETIIRWIPALCDEQVSVIFLKLVLLCPSELVVYGKVAISKTEQVKTALACIFAELMDHNLPTTVEKYSRKPIVNIFFTQKSFAFHKDFQTAEIPFMMNQWLSNFYVGNRPYQFYLMIKNKDEDFKLQLKISLDGKQAPISLKKVLKNNSESKLAILSDISIIVEYIPALAASINSNKAVCFVIDDFVPLFLEVLPVLKSMGIVVALPKSLRKILQPTLTMNLQHKKSASNSSTPFLKLDELLSFDWQIAIGDKKLSILEFNKLIKKSNGFIKILDEYVILDEEKMKKLVAQLKNIPDNLNNTDLMQAILAGELSDAQVVIDDQIKTMFDQLKNFSSVAIPHNLKANLRPYQERGFNWLVQNISTGFGSILADDMGLGKTLQVIAVILHLKNQGALQSARVLVVAPTGLLSNWVKEIERFAPDLKVHVYHGPHRNLDFIDQYDVIITSYGHARSDQKKLSEIAWMLLVIDEAQNIKNPFTEQTKALKAIPSTYKIAMSGTPVENRLLEYWSIFDFTNKHYLGNAKLFQDRFVIPIERDRDKKCLEAFKKITSPFILRRLKNDKNIIQDLPDKIEKNRYCSLTSEQTAMYQQIVNITLTKIESAQGIERKGLILSLINSLKQICNHPSQFGKQKSATIKQSDKMQALTDILIEVDELEEKTLIFTQYTEMGNIISKLLSEQFKKEIPFLHGGLTRAQRDEIVQNFQHESQSRILIISLKAGGTGLNLTAANHVVHYDLWWNPAVEAQATDRAYRIGQKSNVMVHRLIVSGTFEERIDEMIQSKKELANLTVGSGESWITEMSSEQLKDLVKLRGKE